jgi:hypothetical protein
MKKNCWQFKGCGREPGGKNEKTLGTCPASVERKLDGVHGGTNAGRACWVVAGTLCGGVAQGTFAQKFKNCNNCDFYLGVKKDEDPGFKLAVTLLALLK